MTIFSPGPASAMSVDLTSRELFVRKGFSHEWTTGAPSGRLWLKVPASGNGLRRVRISELPLEGRPEHAFLSFKKFRPEHYTMVTSFMVSGSDLTRAEIPGLFLKSIAFNWEIYLNGHLLRKEMFPDGEGGLASLREYRDVLIPLNPMLMREGSNILSFHIVGDPTSIVTGFYRAGPYNIGDYHDLALEHSETVRLILMFMYLFAGIYLMLLYLYRKEDRYNFTFALTTIFTFLYFFSRTHIVYSIIPDTNVLTRIEFVVLFMILPMGSMFFDQVLTARVSRANIGIFAFYLFLAVMVIPVPYRCTIDILRIWQFTAAIPLSLILIQIISIFVKKVREDASTAGHGKPLISTWLNVLKRETVGNLLLGVLLICFSVVFDIIDALYLAIDLGVSKYTFLGVILGMTMILRNRFIEIHRRVEALNVDLEHTVQELSSANELISISEKRYRAIVEGANDIVLSLDTELNIISANRAIEKHLKIKKESADKLNFIDLVHSNNDELNMNRQIFLDKFDDFLRNRETLSLRTDLVSSFMKEPIPMNIRFQFVDAEGSNEIIGTASDVGDDSLLRYFTAEKQRYVIENYLITADEISRRVTRNLTRYINQKEADHARLALREIVLNAVEHGNLDISFKEKSEAMMNDSYFDLIALRQNDTELSKRKVTVEYSINSKRAVYLVIDEGSGFDHKKITRDSAQKANEDMLSHGRGIAMARNIFDEVKYLGPGNMVKLVKHF